LLAQILNYGGASIGGNAAVNVVATTLSVNGNLDSQITNGTGGTINGSATIDFSVSGNSTITNGSASFQIFGSDGAASAAININGGNYSVPSGTFLGNIDGNGTFTLNNATIAADTVKVGVFGSNGILRIGGSSSSISANTLLHLYAPGSNGLIDFVANTTLNSSGTAAVIAANTVTVENGVVVTIGGSTPANVYANVPNYSGRNGGNNSTSGTFAGAGATTQPLGGQPPFVSATAARAATKQATASAGGRGPAIHVTDSSQLGALLNNATLGPDGKVRLSPHERSRNPAVQGSTRTVAAELHRSADAGARSGLLASRLQ
jgi:hypothetical protein